MREFQMKLLSGLIFTNKSYKAMARKTSTKCMFCNEEQQDLVHLYISCKGVNRFRSSLSQCWTGEEMSQKRWFLGCSDSNEDLEKYKDYIAKEINHYIFQTNWAENDLSLTAFKNRILSQEEIEEAIASETDTLFDFYVKWENLKILLNN